MTLEEKKQKYLDLVHAMQSGVAAKMGHDGGARAGEASPKHLRVGVNSAMVDIDALSSLLVEKDIITEDEYYDVLIVHMEAEIKMYEDYLSEKIGGAAIKLA